MQEDGVREADEELEETGTFPTLSIALQLRLPSHFEKIAFNEKDRIFAQRVEVLWHPRDFVEEVVAKLAFCKWLGVEPLFVKKPFSDGPDCITEDGLRITVLYAVPEWGDRIIVPVDEVCEDVDIYVLMKLLDRRTCGYVGWISPEDVERNEHFRPTEDRRIR